MKRPAPFSCFRRARSARTASLGLLLCLLAARLPAEWTWSPRTDGSDLWLTAAEDGNALFDLRLGSAGSIAELHYLPAGGRDPGQPLRQQ